MKLAHLDFETRSYIDLPKRGAYIYAQDPSTEVLCLCYEIDGGPIQSWVPGQPFPADLRAWIAGGGMLAAHNAAFDRLIWWFVAENDHNFPPAPLEQWYCTAAQARARGLPGKLEDLGRCLGLKVQKDKRGAELIKLMSIPPFEWSEELLAEMVTYCRTDVEVERAAAGRSLPLTEAELAAYWVSERINDRGLLVDVEFARAATGYARAETAAIGKRLAELTDGDVTTPRQFARLKDWVRERLSERGRKALWRAKTDRQTKVTEWKETLDKHTREILLGMIEEDPDVATDPRVQEVLELTSEAGRTSVGKYQAMVDRADPEDERVRGAYIYAGAGQTGRWSSTGLQVHNFVRDTAKDPDAIADKVLAGEPLDDVMGTLASMLRPSIVPAEGHIFVCGDWSGIENRVLPWLSRGHPTTASWELQADRECQARLDRLADPDNDEYVRTAKTFGGDRQEGKVCIAEGSPVLTDRGLVPIEHVTRSMRVWDGQDWVYHQGLVYQGDREVISYGGLTATPDHVVFTEDGPMQLGDAASRRSRLVQSGAGWQPLRVGRNHQPRAPLHAGLARRLCSNTLHRLRTCGVAELEQLDEGRQPRLSGVFSTSANTCLAVETSGERETSVRDAIGAAMARLWRPWRSFRVLIGAGCRFVGDGASGAGERQRAGPHRQQWSLRTGESAVGHPCAAVFESADIEIAGELDLRRGAVALRPEHREAASTLRADAGRDPRAGAASCCGEAQGLAPNRRTARVYDLVNAGPRRRFTVSGVLVHNCELSMGYAGGVGAFQAMARNYGVKVDDARAEQIKTTWRRANPWAPLFWQRLEAAAVKAMLHPGEWFQAGRLWYGRAPGGPLYCRLPSGRLLAYPEPSIDEQDKWGNPRLTAIKGSWKPKVGDPWPRFDLWNGLQAENGTQAASADILAECMQRVDARLPGRIVGHTHDELLLEVLIGEKEAARTVLEQEMLRRPSWAGDLPLAVKVWTGYWYRK